MKKCKWFKKKGKKNSCTKTTNVQKKISSTCTAYFHTIWLMCNQFLGINLLETKLEISVYLSNFYLKQHIVLRDYACNPTCLTKKKKI